MTDRSPLTADQQAELDLLHALEDREQFLIGIIHELQAKATPHEWAPEALSAIDARIQTLQTVATGIRELMLTSSPVESPR